MADEQRSIEEGARDGSSGNHRREYLKLVTAGALGGAVGFGIDRFTGVSDGSRAEPPGDDGGGPAAYDVFVHQRGGDYEAVDSAKRTIATGENGWGVLQDGIDAAPEGGSVLVEGEFESGSTIEINKSIRMDGPDASIRHQTSGDYVFRFEGVERRRTSLTEPAETGDQAVQLDDASGLQAGDLVLLEEGDEQTENVLGRDLPAGEAHSVLEVNGSTVRLEDSIVWRGGYSPRTLVYAIDPIEVHVSGFSMSAPRKDESYYGVSAHMCRDSTFRNLWLEKFGSRGILLEACANVRVRDCTVLQSADVEASDGYGIQVWAGCHDVLVDGCAAKECRHPLSVTPGGDRAVASRSITFRDCFVTASGGAALNCHGGGAHDLRFAGCMVHTWGQPGVRTGAQETNVSGCEFRMDGHNAIHTRNEGQEMIVTVTDSDVFGAANAIKLNQDENFDGVPLWKLVHVEGVRAYGCDRFFELGRNEIDRVRALVIRGCYWDSVSDEGIRIWNRLDGGVIEGNDFGESEGNSHIHAPDGPNTNVQNLKISGNRFFQSNGTEPFIRLSESNHCVVSDNQFQAASDRNIYVDETNSTANLITENAYFAPNPSADPVAEAEGSLAIDNRVYDTEANVWL